MIHESIIRIPQLIYLLVLPQFSDAGYIKINYNILILVFHLPISREKYFYYKNSSAFVFTSLSFLLEKHVFLTYNFNKSTKYTYSY